MHMADALLSPATAGVMYAASGAALALSVRRIAKEKNSEILPLMAVVSALVFAGQMINYTIPGTGSSGHICGGMLLTAILGPYAAFISLSVIFTIQCLFFADGGLLALGANCWNMAFYGCFVGYYLIWRPIIKSGLFANQSYEKASRMKIIAASIIGCIITLQFGAFSVVIETSLSGITDLPFGTFCAVMQPIHLAIGLVEGLATSAILVFLFNTRPEMLTDIKDNGEKQYSLKKIILIISLLAVFTGGVLSLFASSLPDGLEWSLFGNEEKGYAKNMGLNEENYGIKSNAADIAASIQEKTAFLPDYAFPESGNSAGASLSGLLGSAIVAGVSLSIYFFGKVLRRKNRRQE